LATKKPPTMYDGQKAHHTFDFIDPTWAPGVTHRHLEEGVAYSNDTAMEKAQTVKVQVKI
jgi:hypothetical protein